MADPSLYVAAGSLGVSFAAFGVAIWSAVRTVKLRTAQVEAQVRGAVSAARKSYEDLVASNSELLGKVASSGEDALVDAERSRFEIVKRILASRQEDTVNAYEDACAKYRDGKLDKSRFKKSFRTELRLLVEDKEHQQYFNAVTSKYKAILAVYKEWENMEE